MISQLDLFFLLSKTVTGDSGIPKSLATEYLDRINAHFEADLAALLGKFGKIAESQNLEDDFDSKIFKVASKTELYLTKQVILLWYTGQFNTPDGRQMAPETEQQYKLQRMYSLIKAPVRGYSNHDPKAINKYGYWKTKP